MGGKMLISGRHLGIYCSMSQEVMVGLGFVPARSFDLVLPSGVYDVMRRWHWLAQLSGAFGCFGIDSRAQTSPWFTSMQQTYRPISSVHGSPLRQNGTHQVMVRLFRGEVGHTLGLANGIVTRRSAPMAYSIGYLAWSERSRGRSSAVNSPS